MELPYDCPFHLDRDLFANQQAAKYEYRPNQWTCKLCGKLFLTENDIDNHFGRRHIDALNMVNIKPVILTLF